MPRLIVTLDGITLRDMQLSRERTTIGRRPYNDLVIDNLAVSGDHAVILRGPGGTLLEDLGSTNGTRLNGRAIERAPLQHQDQIDIGKYRLRYIDEIPTANFERTMVVRPGTPLAGDPSVLPPVSPAASAGAQPRVPMPALRSGADVPASIRSPSNRDAPPARVKVVSGGAVGRELPLVKVVTTIGRPGGAIAAITRRGEGYTIAHVEGSPPTRLNGNELERQAMSLRSGDRLDLAGVHMEFLLD